MKMTGLLLAVIISIAIPGCMLDEVRNDVDVIYYNGSYGYWNGGVWYVAPPGYIYGRGPVYWGPNYRPGYGYRRPGYGYPNRGGYGSGRGGYGGGRDWHGGRGGWHR